MAEVIGVVAATLEFTKVFLELKEITSSIRHAPEEIRELIEELNLTDDILQTLAEQDAMLSVYAPPAVTQKCRESCKKAVEILKPVCIQLSKSIEQSRWRGSLRTLLKDAFLEKARMRIERAKSNLHLAQMATFSALSALNLQQHTSTRALVLSALSVASPLHSSDDGESQHSNPDAAKLTCDGTTDSHDQSHNGNSALVAHIGKRPTQRMAARYTTPLLILQNLWLGKRFEIIWNRARGVSTFTIRTYNLLPEDAPVFEVAKRGDVAEMQTLFQKKEATIFDRDERGRTLLMGACGHHRAAMVRFLVHQGCDFEETDSKGYTGFRLLLLWSSNIDADTLHPLTGATSFDVEPRAVWTAVKYQPQIIANIIPMICPPWYTVDFKTRLAAAYCVCGPNGKLDDFWALLSQRRLDVSCLTRRIKETEDVHDSLVRTLASAMSADCLDLQGWQSLLQSAVKLNGFRLSFEKKCDSPMLTYLGFHKDQFHGDLSDLNNPRLSCKLREWAREVLGAGQNLQLYGRWEKNFLLRCGSEFGLWHNSQVNIRFLNLEYGPSPEDWQIWVTTSLDEHVGEFWQGALNVEPVIALPGSWPHRPARMGGGIPHHSGSGRDVKKKAPATVAVSEPETGGDRRIVRLSD